MYFYDIENDAFIVKGIHDIPSYALSVSDSEYVEFIEKRNQGAVLYIEEGQLKATTIRPSVDHEWTGTEWIITDAKQAELKFQKHQQYITSIDDKAASIYSIWTRFESEYRERKDAALAFQAENYQGEVSRYITDFAQKANLDNKTATDIILQQAAGLEKLQVEFGRNERDP